LRLIDGLGYDGRHSWCSIYHRGEDIGSVLDVLQHVFVAWLIIAEPWFGHRMYRDLELRGPKEPGLRATKYRQSVIWQWAWMPVVAVLFLKTPSPFSAVGFHLSADWGGGIFLPILGGLLVASLMMRYVPAYRNSAERQLAIASAILPETKRERGLFALLAITAGVCEEVVYRGFLMFYLTRYLPGLHPVAIAVMAGVIFGWGHIYQGWKGVLLTTVMGVLFGTLYWNMGSIIPGMVIHALVDLRILLIVRRPAAAVDVGDEA
jgi:membrane protease YdiL (CAAX protease family)